jgi:hypothetical protein
LGDHDAALGQVGFDGFDEVCAGFDRVDVHENADGGKVQADVVVQPAGVRTRIISAIADEHALHDNLLLDPRTVLAWPRTAWRAGATPVCRGIQAAATDGRSTTSATKGYNTLLFKISLPVPL